MKRLNNEDRGQALREKVNVRIREVQKKIEEMKEKRQTSAKKTIKNVVIVTTLPIKNEEEKMKNMQRHGATEDASTINSEKLKPSWKMTKRCLRSNGRRAFCPRCRRLGSERLETNVDNGASKGLANYNPIVSLDTWTTSLTCSLRDHRTPSLSRT